jgi:hypothetical protein
MLFGGNFGGARQIVGLVVIDVVTLVGAAVPSRRVSGVTLPRSPPCTKRNARISSGSSIVIVAFLLEGATCWYAIIQMHRSAVGLLRRV